MQQILTLTIKLLLNILDNENIVKFFYRTQNAILAYLKIHFL